MDSTNAAYARPVEFTPIPEKFSGGSSRYDDGGVDSALQHGGNGTRVWRMRFEIRNNPTQAAVLDSHFVSAKWLEDEGMSAETFNFRERSDIGTTLFSGVRYTRYEVSHTKTWAQVRDIELTKFP